jgi:hypothetical protein
MKSYLAAVLSLAALAFIGCSTTTETKIEHDTTIVDNTVRSALVRFVSLLPDNSEINLRLTRATNQIFATTLSLTPNSYIPFVPDSSRWLYLFSGNNFLDSIQVAGTQIRKGSVNTFGLFYVQSRILAAGGDNNDSIKLRPVPNGYAMVRFINGNNWLSGSQQTVDLDTESLQTPILTSVFEQPPTKYVAIPAGTHKLILSISGTHQAVDSVTPKISPFEAGMFYTVRFLGDSQHPGQLTIDPE